MNFNLDDLIKFYNSELGLNCVNIIQEKLDFLLQGNEDQEILGLGYILPYLINNRIKSRLSFLSVPSANNKIKFIKNSYNSSIEIDEKAFPFKDLQFDKIFVSHWLEVSDRLDLVMSEIWRVLKGQGKIILIIPNAFSFWALRENTPFGKCRSFSQTQMKKLLHLHGFEEIKLNFCLYFPPIHQKFLLTNYKTLEYIGGTIFKNFGGVMIVEATKFNYAIPKNKLKTYRYKLPKVSIQQQI